MNGINESLMDRLLSALESGLVDQETFKRLVVGSRQGVAAGPTDHAGQTRNRKPGRPPGSKNKPEVVVGAAAAKKRKFSAETRKRMAEAQRKRWAKANGSVSPDMSPSTESHEYGEEASS